MALDARTGSQSKIPPGKRSWASTSSRQVLKNYDKSPLASPSGSPPGSGTTTPILTRNNSSASINSTQSEPSWHSRRHQSEPSIDRGRSQERKESNASQASVQTTASHKQRKGSFKGLFSREKDPAAKEKKKKDTERIVLGSRHAAAVQTKMMLDPSYRQFVEKHKKPDVKTAGINQHTKSAHSSAADLEARHPHSGPPAVHGALDLPMLSKIESHDEDDDEIDPWEAQRRQWNEAKQQNLHEIPEMRSRQASPRASPWASPMASREPSPNRLGGVARPALGSKRNSWAGGYSKDPATGRWRKTPPSMTPVLPQPGEMDPNLLAKSLAERLNTAA